MKLREGNIFTGVCLSMGWDVMQGGSHRERGYHEEGCAMKGGCCEGGFHERGCCKEGTIVKGGAMRLCAMMGCAMKGGSVEGAMKEGTGVL